MTAPTPNSIPVKCSAFLALAVSTLVFAGSAGAGVSVWFVEDGKPVQVERAGTTIQQAVRQLLAGPTPAERSRGVRSAVPHATELRSLTVSRRIVTVDLGARFAAGSDARSLQDRVGQLLRTIRGVPGVLGVRVLVDGGVPVGLFPGYDLRRPVTAAIEPAAVREPTVRDYQQILVDLGFMAPTGLTGIVDMQTSTAVLGFQKWAGLPRDGTLGEATMAALDRATRPEPRLHKPGRRIEVQLRRQLALLIEDDKVVRAVHISSGAYGKTPSGSFRIYRKERYSWSVPFKVWLPWASYFSGGVAFHEFGSVPSYAASHGCIRVNHYDAEMLFGFADDGHAGRRLRRGGGVNGRVAVRALAGGLGVAALLVFAAAAAALTLVALGLPTESRADDPPPAPIAAPKPAELVVALSLGDPALQAGVVRDGRVILARGLEVEIARALARRLGIPRVRFVEVRPASRLIAARVRSWDLTIASIRPVPAAAAVSDLSDPYLATDQAVVLRHGLAPLGSLAELRGKVLCAVRFGDGARAIATTVKPSTRPLLAQTPERLLELLRTGACDAALVDATAVGRFVAGHGAQLGPVRARVASGGGLVVAVTRGGPIAVADVNAALARMRDGGTLHRLARAWLGIDPVRLRRLG